MFQTLYNSRHYWSILLEKVHILCRNFSQSHDALYVDMKSWWEVLHIFKVLLYLAL